MPDYLITLGKEKGVSFTCRDCPYTVRVAAFVMRRLGNPRTQAASAMHEHIRVNHPERKRPAASSYEFIR